MHETTEEMAARAARLMRQGAFLIQWRGLPEYGANGVGLSWGTREYDGPLPWSEGRGR